MKKKHKQQGQMLLIVILLSTVLLTVALSISQLTTEETKIAKLEEEQKKAFAAAEAGIEARLQSTANIGNIVPLLGGGTSETTGIATGSATLSISQGASFITPLITKDNQYTFYFAEYDAKNNSFANYFNGGINIYFSNQSADNCPSSLIPSLEMTYISSTNDITRYLIDPCDKISNPLGDKLTANYSLYTLNDVKFYWGTTVLTIQNTKLIIIRTLFNSTKLAIKSDVNLKPQGMTVTSYAVTTTNVSKKIQLFQSYPQIPADLFVTSF